MSMKILISNDDGINSHGIARLARAAKNFGEVWVVAPNKQKSGSSHSINLHTPVAVKEEKFKVKGVRAFSVKGSPADCVRIGILNLLPEKPDFVLSGINFGVNAGTDVMYSGTIGAAMEARFQEIPAAAISEGTNIAAANTDEHILEILEEVFNTPLQYNEIVNVNFPDCKPQDCRGVLRDRFVSHSQVYKDSYTADKLTEKITTYMVQGTRGQTYEPGSDLQALRDNYISIGMVRNMY
ncbi:MAG: 5'/3'-nucleotidase SurE [Lachnospiraceae bacterium]|jgi:5'-nucleotidase|nr:5'/3'-nucleotidase SurE [Lachnospiraceae bacterium]